MPRRRRTRAATARARRLPVGAEVVPNGVHFRVWAPRRKTVSVVLEDAAGQPTKELELTGEAGGYFSGESTEATVGTRYRYRLDDVGPFPDLASRFQPMGPQGASQVVDPSTFAWTDGTWSGVPLRGHVIYEMHIGTFTEEGTWDAACQELSELKTLGVNILEVMPVAEYPGRFGWGYDGVGLFAPTRLYGEPDHFRRFVDRAHALGLAVILDVVYNHVGPRYSYFRDYSPAYFSDRYANEWGESLNFDGPNSDPVREFFVANAAYWIDEFHCDGLRLDATQQIFDASREHVITAIQRRVREAAAGRRTYIVAENEPQQVHLLHSPDAGGFGLDAMWNDDFHHSAQTALTGRNDAYYSDYEGTAQEFVSAAKGGFLYQGQHSAWQGKSRGTPTAGVARERFVNFLQNHDQVANSAKGLRLHALTAPSCYRAMTALLLLLPGAPMLFQGQEFCASAPFLFFADHEEGLAGKVAQGRREFLSQFPSLATEQMRPMLADPADPRTFMRSKLDLTERQSHAEAYALHKDLLALRRSDPALQREGTNIDGAVFTTEAFCIRFFGTGDGDRLLLVNLGLTLTLRAVPEPLLAPPPGRRWNTLWSSEDPSYGGDGTLRMAENRGWELPGHAALLLAAVPKGEENG